MTDVKKISITGYEDYSISEDAIVYDIDFYEVEQEIYNNYLTVRLHYNSELNHIGKRFIVHRLVAREFIGNIEDLLVHHIDGDKLNNEVDNLKILTQSEHMILHKTGKHRSESTKRKIKASLNRTYRKRKIKNIVKIDTVKITTYNTPQETKDAKESFDAKMVKFVNKIS